MARCATMGRGTLSGTTFVEEQLPQKGREANVVRGRTPDGLWLSQCPRGPRHQDRVKLEMLPCRCKLVVTVIREKCSCVRREAWPRGLVLPPRARPHAEGHAGRRLSAVAATRGKQSHVTHVGAGLRLLVRPRSGCISLLTVLLCVVQESMACSLLWILSSSFFLHLFFSFFLFVFKKKTLYN